MSVAVVVGGYKVDLVPGRRQSGVGNDHSLFLSKANTWTKTNVKTHIADVRKSRRYGEIRILKLWRDQRGLHFPSFYLELATIRALRNRRMISLCRNVEVALTFFRDNLISSRFLDPANTANVISNELSLAEKSRIATAAGAALRGRWCDLVV